MKILKTLWLSSALMSAASIGFGAGILTPVDSPDSALKIKEHHVSVVINNGYARTEVQQVFLNESETDREAIYAVPVPENGSLSELEMMVDEKLLTGEVVKKEDAERIYEEEKLSGNDAGLASKESYQRFEFRVSRVPAQGEARMRYVYYESLVIDAGIGRYAYSLEEGGTDEAEAEFWTRNSKVESDFSIQVELKSAWPVEDVRTPGLKGLLEKIDEKTVRYSYQSNGAANLETDFVFYYKLQDGLPGRLEMMTYRRTAENPGSFLLLLTPGEDLEKLSEGADYVFVLDVSGSMQGKLHTLTSGVKRTIGQLQPNDRFRIVAFNRNSWDLTSDWLSATEGNVSFAAQQIDELQSNGGTNVYAGVKRGLRGMDSDRVSSLILVTDGVTNQGILDPRKFHELLHNKDIRFYGFLLGNSSNWQLMRVMCEASGGYYKSVSNADDVLGEIVLAKNKIVRQAIHDAELKIEGVKTFDVSDFQVGKIFHGQQLAFFGRYENGGEAKIRLTARISGEDKVYETRIQFPDKDESHPELERMWAMDQVQKIQVAEMIGFAEPNEAKAAIADIGVAYQIVTDHTSMVALDDDGFARHGIDRRNRERTAIEHAAQANRTASGAQRVDTNQPMYDRPAPSVEGGGAFGPWFVGLTLAGLAFGFRKSRKACVLCIGAIVLVSLVESQDLRAAENFRVAHAANATSTRLNLNHSLRNFWEISEKMGREFEAEEKELIASNQRSTTYRSQFESPRLNQEMQQNVSSNQKDKHFGLRLFDGIPLFDFTWGETKSAESESFRGNLSR